MSKNGSILALMDKFLEDARAEKKAELGKDAGRGDTSHPVMSADNGTKPANEGERGKENDADIRKNLGEVGNSGQRDANSASSTKPTDTIGTTKMDASEVKGNVQTPKSTKEGPAEKGRGDASPGHPSNTTFSEKYSSVIELGNKLLASLAASAEAELNKSADDVSENAQKKVPEQPAPVVTAKHEDKETPAEEKKEEDCKKAEDLKKAAAEKHTEDAEAGYLAAQLLATEVGLVKGAGAEAAVDAQIASITKSAEEDATNFVAFLNSHAEGMNMAAKERAEMAKKAEPDAEPDPAQDAAPEAAPEGDPAAMLGGGGDVGGGGGDEEIERIAELLAQAGVTPEELEAALAAETGGGGEGMPGVEAGGGIPAEALAAAAGGAPGA